MTGPPAIFDLDDYPRGAENAIAALDMFKAANPAFLATVFAIPAEMNKTHWRLLDERREWIRVGMHGFTHEKGECREISTTTYRRELARHYDPRFGTYFKAPQYGYSTELIQTLRVKGWTVALRHVLDVFAVPPFRRYWVTAIETSVGMKAFIKDNHSNYRLTHTGRPRTSDVWGMRQRLSNDARKATHYAFSGDMTEWV